MRDRRFRTLAVCLSAAILAAGPAALAGSNLRWITTNHRGTLIHKLSPQESAVPQALPAAEPPATALPAPTVIDPAPIPLPVPAPEAVVPEPAAAEPPLAEAPLAEAPPRAAAPCDRRPRPEPVGGSAGAGRGLTWISGEYLLWYLRGGAIPAALVTTGQGDPAAPGTFTRQVLFGDERVNGDLPFSGARISFGSYADDLGIGVEASGFCLEDRATRFALASGPGGPALARPFLNVANGADSVNLISFDDAVAGAVAISAHTRAWGGEANVCHRVELGTSEVYYGFRYLGLREELAITDSTVVLPDGVGLFNNLPVGPNQVRVKHDRFRTTNSFYGGQLGMRLSARLGGFDLGLRSAVALGTTVQFLDVRGTTTLITPGVPNQELRGGLLAGGLGGIRETRSNLSVLPEVELSLGYQLGRWARLSVGYNFLYCSSVLRPGEQIDTRVDLTQVPVSPTYNPAATATPEVLFRGSSFWMQGINAGLTLAF